MKCASMHTGTSHKNDQSKYLSYYQRNAIHKAVSAHPQAKPTKVRLNLKNFSLSKHVIAICLKSEGYPMLQERDTLAVNEFYGISVDDTVQSVWLFFLSKCIVGRLDRATVTQRCRRFVCFTCIYLLQCVLNISLIKEMICPLLLCRICTCSLT